MTKFFTVLLLLTAALPACALTLVKDGAPAATIYLPSQANANTALKRAVSDLNYHLKKMSGAELAVVETDDMAQVKAPAVVLGDLAVKLGAVPQKTGDSQEGFRLLTKSNLLLIGGQSDDAVLFGVDTLLERLGCDWVMPGEIGEIIPEKKTVEIGALDESQAPAFLVRRLWYRGGPALVTGEDAARFDQWSRRQKAGGYNPPALQTAGHYWPQFIGKHRDEFDKDPTMLALTRGADGTLKRLPPQIETTHPRVVELFAQDIRNTFEQNHWPHDKAVGFPIGPADGLGYSQSVESQLAGSGRIDPIVGEADQTDLLVLLANIIFEKLGAEYPNVYLGNYSYSVHADYPMKYKPHPHYVQIFAPINFSRFHSLLDENSKTQAYYKSVVEQWGKLANAQGNPLIYRGYNWNLAENMMPYSKLEIWGTELPFYHRMKMLGLNVEATKAWSVNGPSDWLFMKMAWNSGQDWKALLKDYCRKSFGDGAAPMERYFLRQTQRQKGAGQEAGSYYAFPLIYDDVFIKAARTDFEEATRLAKTAPQKTRVQIFADNITALELYLKYFRATEDFDFAAAKTGYEAMLAHWQKQYDTNSDLVAKEVPQYLKSFVGGFIDAAVKYSSGDYKMVAPLPDELPTVFDPNTIGNFMRFQNPEVNDAQFVKTKTFSSTWDAQGLSGLRSGAVWYRHHFKVPANLKDKPIGLFIGGVEDEARVWINGHLIGTSGVQFSSPIPFDLTEGINYEGDNVLAIQVIRNSAANEIGLGGILRPSFLFTGQRLEAKAPKPLELRRVLPGGERGEVQG